MLKKELIAHLRSLRITRRGKTATTAGQPRGRIIDAVSIREKPAYIESHAVPGQSEDDLLLGARNTHTATLVERQSRFVMLVKVAGKDTESVVSALIREVKKLPRGAMETLTWDRGSELDQHKRFTVDTDVAMYFCDPRSPRQRRINVNTSRLLRQYLPDGTDLANHTQSDLYVIAQKLNTRPRKTLAYMALIDKLAELLR